MDLVYKCVHTFGYDPKIKTYTIHNEDLQTTAFKVTVQNHNFKLKKYERGRN